MLVIVKGSAANAPVCSASQLGSFVVELHRARPTLVTTVPGRSKLYASLFERLAHRFSITTEVTG
jgi:hypothetical protein